MTPNQLSGYNVIASYSEEDAARRAVSRLHDEGIPAEEISYLGSAAQARSEDLDGPGEEDVDEVPAEVGKGVVGGGMAGGAAGGAAGFLAGLAAVALPGAGPLVGAGIWAAAAGGAVAGATAGGVGGGIVKMWEEHYKDTLGSGGALVGVHSDDQRRVHEAALSLEKERPNRIDHIDPEGRILDE